jgi:sulfide:quinone oxidoreductase
LPASDDIVVFDQYRDHTFWPSLLWVMTGTRKPEQVQRPLTGLREKNIRVVQARIDEMDPSALALVAGHQRWTGDAMVIALGADLDPAAISGLDQEPGNFYTLAGASWVWQTLQELKAGRVVILISRTPFKCPAAPYEAAMLIDGYLRQRHRREQVAVEVWAYEPAPMAVAGPAVSESVVKALRDRDIEYFPNQSVESVDAQQRRLRFSDGRDLGYDLLAYVPPHRVPPIVVQAGLAPEGGWVAVDPQTLETSVPNVFAVGDVTGIVLPMNKPLPKAGVFAHRQAEVVADIIAHRLTGRGTTATFDGVGECFIEMGRGIAGFARGNFYATPTPSVRAFTPGRHWHAGKVAFERHWWAQWWS